MGKKNKIEESAFKLPFTADGAGTVRDAKGEAVAALCWGTDGMVADALNAYFAPKNDLIASVPVARLNKLDALEEFLLDELTDDVCSTFDLSDDFLDKLRNYLF